MGGHALARGSAGFRDAARLGFSFAQAGYVVATGGGSGAMEAANLGAWCRSADQLEPALKQLATVTTRGLKLWVASRRLSLLTDLKHWGQKC